MSNAVDLANPKALETKNKHQSELSGHQPVTLHANTGELIIRVNTLCEATQIKREGLENTADHSTRLCALIRFCE